MSSISIRKEKNQNQNIQVFVRLRPLNARERDIKSVGVVEVSGTREVLVRQSPLDARLSKKFTFDRAFGPNSNQVDVYREVVSPLIDEVLAGYNCTVFAYGQTGTGKTHTMVGDSTPDQDLPWQNDPMSGIIPRSLSQLFDELRITNSEYTVRVSYLELYNEELFDLLSASEDNSKLRIYEDVTRKGSNIVNGLEEVTVYSKNEVYKIMAKGQEKRRMASTLMNAQSSRSHTVFTIVVHMKENSPDGEELMKVGKLNLVDLAGSENISKAGTDNPSRKERARECVNINQSLLTLGRVITALVERHPHIPYRESKLTRLLQESLGGRTKTSIIATISPGHKDVEETLSTLEYANRAKNIQNKPEINQKITKHAVLKEYSEEIDRLKRDLLATREKNGVYLAQETYTEMTLKIEEQEKEIQDKILYIKAVKDEKEKMENLFAEMSNSLHEKNRELDKTNKHLVETKDHLNQTKQKLTETTLKTEEHEYVINKQVETESKLSKQAKDLLSVADVTTTDIDNLQNTVAKKKALEEYNLQNTRTFGEKAKSCRIIIKDHVHDFTASHLDSLRSLSHILDRHHNVQVKNHNSSKQLMETITAKLTETITHINTDKDSRVSDFEHFCQDKFGELERNAAEESSGVHNNLANLIKLIDTLDDIRQKDLHNLDTLKLHIASWNDNSMKKVLQLQEKQNKFMQEMTDKFDQLKKSYDKKEENHHKEYEQLQTMRKQYQEEISNDIVDIKKTLSEKLEALQQKRDSQYEKIFTMENNSCRNYEKDSDKVAAVIADTGKELSERGKDIADNINDLVNQDNDFHNKMNAVISQYSGTVDQQTTSYDLIKNAGLESRSSSLLAWSKHQGIEAAVKETIMQQHKHSADSASRALQVTVEGCKAECVKCSGRLEDGIKQMGRDADENNEQIAVLRDTVEGHKTDMEEHLNVCDVIESTYLEQEYKTYSPTGKTPLRTLYRYSRDLANTSPHEQIRQRFRNYRCNTLQVNELDQSIEEDEKRTSSGDDNTSVNTTDNDSSCNGEEEVFLKPETPPAQLTDIFDDQQLKENLSQDKKEFTSKLKQPSSLKKVLGAKN